MPLYEYRCEKCHHLFEELVSSRSPAVTCPHCESRKVVRQLSTFAAHAGSAGAKGPCGERCADGACDVPAKAASGGGCCGGSCCH